MAIWSRNKEVVGRIGLRSYLSDQEKYINFDYTHTSQDTGVKTDLDYDVELLTTPCNFSGHRYWLKCPIRNGDAICGARVGVLYLYGKYFMCRKCADLTYSSKNMSGYWGMLSRAIELSDITLESEGIRRKFYSGRMTRKYRMFRKKKLKLASFGGML